MLLVRHYKPRPPFDDYSTLSVEELDALAEQRIDPRILSFESPDVPPAVADALREGRPVFCSPSLRTRETYETAYRALVIAPHPPLIDTRLAEIRFTPSTLVGGAEQPLEALRKTLYPALFAGSPGIEPLRDVLERVEGFLNDDGMRDAVCFTHGFLMRFIKAYLLAGKDLERTRDIVGDMPPVGYLEDIHVSTKKAA